MRVLQISNRIPFPLHDGGSIGIFNLAKGYIENGATLTHFVIDTPKLKSDLIGYKKELGINGTVVSVFIDTSIKVKDALLNLIGTKSYHISRFNNKLIEDSLTALLKGNNYDLIHFDGPYLGEYLPLIRSNSNAKVVMRAHNVEHIIWERIVENESNYLKSWYLKLQTKRLKIFETNLLNQFDGIIAISELDKTVLLNWTMPSKIIVSAAGLSFKNYNFQAEFTPHKIQFLGALDWMPNEQGLDWFLDEVWPLVLSKSKLIEAKIAGRNMPEKYKIKKIDQVDFVGEVQSANSFLLESGVLVIPLLSGSGIRIKLLEAMALGVPVITTSIGAEGIDVENEMHVLIANSPIEFANAILYLTNDLALQHKLSENAKHFVQHNFENKAVVKKIVDFYNSL